MLTETINLWKKSAFVYVIMVYNDKLYNKFM